MAKLAIPPIGFLGAGKMAAALAKGWISARLIKADKILASDPMAEARRIFQKKTRARITDNNLQVTEECDVIVLAVKPQHVSEVVGGIAKSLDEERHLLISIAAGVKLAQLREIVGHDQRVVRVMPNTPAQVKACAAAYSAALTATEDDIRIVDRLLNAVGRAFAVPERMLDAVTGLSGSGPAFVFVLIEALSDGGVLMGLPRDVATQLAAQTVLGAAKMVLDTGLHTGELKDMVVSPGGTTAAGLHELERGALRGLLKNAVKAATERALELSKTT